MVAYGTVVSYPIPAYANVPIASQYYIPNQFVISAVTLGQTTIVTTSVDHNYVIGQLCRLIIPRPYGCIQLNGLQGYVISIPSTTQVELDIDSSVNVDNFIAATYNTEQSQILALGDINQGAINNSGRSPTGTFIPGSFINISPL